MIYVTHEELQARKLAWRAGMSQKTCLVLKVRSGDMIYRRPELLEAIQQHQPKFVFLEADPDQDVRYVRVKADVLLADMRFERPVLHAPVVISLSKVDESKYAEFRAGLAQQGVICVEQTVEEFCQPINGKIIEVTL